jgi:hypothetical protein
MNDPGLWYWQRAESFLKCYFHFWEASWLPSSPFLSSVQ